MCLQKVESCDTLAICISHTDLLRQSSIASMAGDDVRIRPFGVYSPEVALFLDLVTCSRHL
jgi:hypothetical protein